MHLDGVLEKTPNKSMMMDENTEFDNVCRHTQRKEEMAFDLNFRVHWLSTRAWWILWRRLQLFSRNLCCRFTPVIFCLSCLSVNSQIRYMISWHVFSLCRWRSLLLIYYLSIFVFCFGEFLFFQRNTFFYFSLQGRCESLTLVFQPNGQKFDSQSITIYWWSFYKSELSQNDQEHLESIQIQEPVECCINIVLLYICSYSRGVSQHQEFPEPSLDVNLEDVSVAELDVCCAFAADSM